jgi:dolichyl-phosphate beta-glucosyltransferase
MNHPFREPQPPAEGASGAAPAPLLSVIFPAYNERERLPQTLSQVLAWLERQPWPWEVLVADDGSRDGTPDLIEREFPRVRVLRAAVNGGKGSAVRRGMLAARGALRLFSDADLSTPIGEVEGMIHALEAGRYDVVIASRALPGSRLVVHQPWWRELAGRTFNRIVQPLAGLPFADTQCGFKLFTARAAQIVFSHLRSTGWAFDVEALMIAQCFSLAILEHPVAWINNEASKVSLLRAAPRMIGDIIQFRWWRLNGTMVAEPAVGQPPVDKPPEAG